MAKDDGHDDFFAKALAIKNAKWWNSRFKAERMNEELEIEEAKTRHPSARN